MAYVLVVDDDEDIAKAEAIVLEKAGHEVHVELGIDEAIESIKARKPDLLILDVMFPENVAGGFELARTMKQHLGEGESVPILMVTAVNSAYPFGFGACDIDQEWLPVTDFIEKPVDLDYLCTKAAALLAGHKGEGG